MPVNCPMTKARIGKIRNTARCYASSIVCAFAELRTVTAIATREIAGAIRSMIASQLAAGRSRLPVRKKASSSITSSMAANELQETIIPTEKPASILDWNNYPSESGEYSNVSKVCFSFSPTKELAAMTDDAMIGMIRKKDGMI